MKGLFLRVTEDVAAALARDPAARGRLEVLLCYPGVHALIAHRAAHALWRRRLRLPARLLSAFARLVTGVEIHPAAAIGRRVFIDHGAGVVIGETARVGDDVLLYHGVTLGGVSHSRGKRHPTVEEGVVIGAGAIVLGPVVIGREARIGAGSVVVGAVPAGCVAVGVPARVVDRRGAAGDRMQLRHDRVIGAAADLAERIEKRIERLERLVCGRETGERERTG